MKPIDINKILVPIDFSSNSMNALQTAAAIAHSHGSQIHLLHVVDSDYELFNGDPDLRPPEFTVFIKKLDELASSVLNSDKVVCNYSTEFGSITHHILKTAIKLDADLIVMGKNGSNGSSNEFAGTQTCQVTEKSRIPVIIVPDQTTKYNFENILFPVRPLLSVPEKYEALRSFILKNNPTILMLNFRNPDYLEELHIIHHLNTLLVAKLEEDKVPFETEYYFKDNCFAEHVLEVLSNGERQFDLAVITAEIAKTNKDFHLGYYAQKIIHQCTIPVMVLHPTSPKLENKKVLNKLEKQTV